MNITIWYEMNDGKRSHNHIENGHVDSDSPNGTTVQVNSWKKKKWEKEFAELIDGIVVHTISSQ
jgi:hypothetical protein